MYLRINRNPQSDVKKSKFIFVGCLASIETMKGEGKRFIILGESMRCPQQESTLTA